MSSPTPRPWFPSSGFVDHREPDPLGGRDRVVLRADDLALGDRQAGRAEQRVRHLLVAGDVHGQRTRPRRHRGADPLLVLPLPELHERLFVQPDERDVPAGRLVKDRLRRRPELPALREQDQPLELHGEIEPRLRLHQVVHESDREPPGLETDVLLGVPVDHVVLATRAGAPRLAARDVRARFPLQLERDVFRHVTQPRAVHQPLAEAAALAERARVLPHAGQQLQQAVVELRDRVRRPLLERPEVHEHADAGLVGPVIRAAEDLRLDDREVGLGPALLGGRGLALGALTVGSGLGAARRHSEASRSAARASSAASSLRARRSNQ